MLTERNPPLNQSLQTSFEKGPRIQARAFFIRRRPKIADLRGFYIKTDNLYQNTGKRIKSNAGGRMKIIAKNVRDLIPYENNPRMNDDAVEYVANSIKEFGFKVPVIIDKNNVVVAGHTRLKACEQLGIKEVPCVVADDLSEEQIKAFRLIDNKTAENALWDYEKLEQELEELNIDMTLFGFHYSEDIEPFDDDLIGNDYIEKECPVCGRIIKIAPGGKVIHEDL